MASATFATFVLLMPGWADPRGGGSQEMRVDTRGGYGLQAQERGRNASLQCRCTWEGQGLRWRGHRALSVQGEEVIKREGQARVAARTGLLTAEVPQRTAAAKVVPRIVAHGRCESHALPTVPQRQSQPS